MKTRVRPRASKAKWLIKFMNLYVHLSVHRARNTLYVKNRENRPLKPFKNLQWRCASHKIIPLHLHDNFSKSTVYPTSPLNRFDSHVSMRYAFHPTIKESNARPGSACPIRILKAPWCGRNPGKPVNIAGEGRLTLTLPRPAVLLTVLREPDAQCSWDPSLCLGMNLAMSCSHWPTPWSPTLVELNCNGSWDGLLKWKTCPAFHSLIRNSKGVLIGMLLFFSPFWKWMAFSDKSC